MAAALDGHSSSQLHNVNLQGYIIAQAPSLFGALAHSFRWSANLHHKFDISTVLCIMECLGSTVNAVRSLEVVTMKPGLILLANVCLG